jgi:hypothetical protein
MAVIDHGTYEQSGRQSPRGNAALFLLVWVGFFVVAYFLNQIIELIF